MSKPKCTAIQAVQQVSGLINEGHQLLTPAMLAALQELNTVVARRHREKREGGKRDHR